MIQVTIDGREEVIKVKRNKDGKVFTTDMSKKECIYEMHFCASYTQVRIQEFDNEGRLVCGEIVCEPVGTSANFIDLIAIRGYGTGEFVGA